MAALPDSARSSDSGRSSGSGHSSGSSDSGRERGWSPDPGTAREEAERLVATAIGAASMAARRIGRTRGPVSSSPLGDALPAGLGTLADALVDRARAAFGLGPNPADYRFANGSPECCVCPVCRTIAAVRDPSPQVAERLATGAGDLAAGVASFLRAVAGGGADQARSGPPPADAAAGEAAQRPAAGQPGQPWPAPEEPVAPGAVGDVWQAATRGAAAAPGPARPSPTAPKAAPPGDAPPGAAPPGTAAPGSAGPARKPMAKKAVKPASGDKPAGRGDEGR